MFDVSFLPPWLDQHVYWAVLLGGWLGLLAWIYLTFFRSRFWRLPHFLGGDPPVDEWPSVTVVIPARNEADVLPVTLPSILNQDYAGAFQVILVNDHSDDGTADVASSIADQCGRDDTLTIIDAEQLPDGWTGKVWAMEQGFQRCDESDVILFTDADIEHPHDSVTSLVSRLCAQNLDLVSLMVQLRVDSFWERFLLPPFVYFFAKLYPFQRVNDPTDRLAAAAGGCMLVRRKALTEAGGLSMIKGCVIDDVAFGHLIKSRPAGGRIWLGLSAHVKSVRSYTSLGEIWRMVARTAFTELKHSTALLIGAVSGMCLIYLSPLLAVALSLMIGVSDGPWKFASLLALPGGAAWFLMWFTTWPILRSYRVSRCYGLLLPLAGMLYTGMTIHSAFRHWFGTRDQWKGRSYTNQSTTT